MSYNDRSSTVFWTINMILDYIRQNGPYYFKSYDRGNAGDFLIAITVRQLFEEINLNIPYLGKDEKISQHCNIIYGGGGGIMVPHWHKLKDLADFFSDPKIDHCLILPQSIYGCDQLVDTFDERFVVLCRDYNSYNYCISRNKRAEFHVADDMALSFNVQQFLSNYPSPLLNNDDLNFQQRFLDSIHTLPDGRKLLLAMREDREGTFHHQKGDLFRSFKSVDLSAIKGGYCGDRELNEKYLYLFLTYLNEVDIILTDRLHSGIGAYLLNKEVYLLDNNYGKLSSVYECSLTDKQNVHYLSTAEDFPYWKDLTQVRKQQPLVSVIIPVYNVERFLVQCLESVVHQTYTNLEIICVNDGSTDNSPAILHDYALKDPRIVEITQKNAGLSATRNTALKVVKGEYTLFLDSDDWLDLKAVEILVEKSELEHLDMLKFSSTLCYEDGRKELDSYLDYDSFLPEYYLTHSFTYKDLLGCPDILWRIPVTAWSCLFRTEYIITHNMTFPDGLNYEDNLFSHIAYLNGGTIACINKQLHFRHKHPNSITSSPTNYFSHLREIMRLNYNLISHLNDPNLLESYLRSCVPSLLHRFSFFPLLIQRRDLHILLTTLKSLLSNHDITQLWPFPEHRTRLTLELLFSEENCLLNKCSYKLQKQVAPIDLRNRISLIREQPCKTKYTYIIFCKDFNNYSKKINSIICNNPEGSEIFCLFDRKVPRSEERSISLLNHSQSSHIYCFRYTNDKVNLLNQIVEISSGEYINFCNESSSHLTKYEKCNAPSPDIILANSPQASNIWESIDDFSFYFFRKGFLIDKNIQFEGTNLDIHHIALTHAESLLIAHLEALKQNNEEIASVPSDPVCWELHNKISHLLDSPSLVSYSVGVTIPALREWFLHSSMSEFKQSLSCVNASIRLLGELHRSASIQLDESMESIVCLHDCSPTWKLRLKILMLRIKMIYSHSSRRKELRHIIRYIRYVANENKHAGERPSVKG